jgi:hypothetical protein
MNINIIIILIGLGLLGLILGLCMTKVRENLLDCCGLHSWEDKGLWATTGICRGSTCDSRMNGFCVGDCCSTNHDCMTEQSGCNTDTQGFNNSGNCCTLGSTGCCPFSKGIDASGNCCDLGGQYEKMGCCSYSQIKSQTCSNTRPICRLCPGVL